MYVKLVTIGKYDVFVPCLPTTPQKELKERAVKILKAQVR